VLYAVVHRATLRTQVIPGQWNQLIMPVGARDALVTLEDPLVPWRITTDDTIPLNAGGYVHAGGGVTWRGTAAANFIFYVNPGSAAPTFIHLLYAVEVPPP
jgi:hypothetical protein